MKELNIFYKAPFGKLYKTRSGRKAVFVGRKSKYLYYLIVQGSPKYLTYFEYGRKFEDNDSNELSDYDIVGEWDFTIKKQWKPSEEQMDALRYVTNFDYGGYKAILVSLYEQLKKLREE